MLQKKTCRTLLMVTALSLASPSIWATTGNTLDLSAGQAPGCDQSEVNAAANAIYQQAKNNYEGLAPQPSNIAQSSCFSNILNMGASIGLTFFNPATLIQQLEQMVCNAAQQALQWPLQQAANVVNQYGQAPYGLGGVTVTPGGSGVTVNSFTSSGPGVSGIPTGNNGTLGSALNDALGG